MFCALSVAVVVSCGEVEVALLGRFVGVVIVLEEVATLVTVVVVVIVSVAADVVVVVEEVVVVLLVFVVGVVVAVVVVVVVAVAVVVVVEEEGGEDVVIDSPSFLSCLIGAFAPGRTMARASSPSNWAVDGWDRSRGGRRGGSS